ncbi:hypothetical protein BV25DRAFT_1824988 [Artomyces pyxidatus]|uniref:Uncharacterized protein n=1 Tax=Artomyces pyxidatus TaxID=48021 RepID=A0ACB8T374_9AGAM|nr:hypothetical protein BV25DRAFT_1824988 [Artomyces pyxidatus]
MSDRIGQRSHAMIRVRLSCKGSAIDSTITVALSDFLVEYVEARDPTSPSSAQVKMHLTSAPPTTSTRESSTPSAAPAHPKAPRGREGARAPARDAAERPSELPLPPEGGHGMTSENAELDHDGATSRWGAAGVACSKILRRH